MRNHSRASKSRVGVGNDLLSASLASSSYRALYTSNGAEHIVKSNEENSTNANAGASTPAPAQFLDQPDASRFATPGTFLEEHDVGTTSRNLVGGDHVIPMENHLVTTPENYGSSSTYVNSMSVCNDVIREEEDGNCQQEIQSQQPTTSSQQAAIIHSVSTTSAQQQYQHPPQYQQEQHVQHGPHRSHSAASTRSAAPSITSAYDICRICHCESSAEAPLISPCCCSGSLKYVHQKCLQQWIKSSQTRSCEVCRFSFIMETKVKPFRKWEKLDISSVERRKILCSVTFHVVAITCVVWSLYVLIDRTADEIRTGQLDWPFWTKLVVVAIGFTGGLVFMYVQCKMYAQLFRRWKSYNKVIYVQNGPAGGTSSTNNGTNTKYVTTPTSNANGDGNAAALNK